MKRMRGRGGVYGGVFFLFWDGKLNCKKNYKIKYNEDLRWPPFYILHVTTNEKHAGMTEGGWDRPRDHARTLGEHNGNDRPLAEGGDDEDNKYGKDSNIPDDDNKHTIGVDGVNEPLDEGDDKCGTLSANPTQACSESQQPSVPSC